MCRCGEGFVLHHTGLSRALQHSSKWAQSMRNWGMRLMRTKGRRRAVVAVARKLAVLLHRMWADGTEFRPAEMEGTARSDPPPSKTERDRPSPDEVCALSGM